MQDKRSNQLRLVGYARVSTQGQGLQAVSVPEQERDMRAWCEAHGHVLVAVCAEEGGVSGAEGLDGRFAFVEALDMVKAGEVDGILVRELDRLARDMLIQEQFMREVWDGGGEVLSTHPSERNLRDDPEDPTRKLLRRMIGCVHEWEREMIKLRLRRGRAHKQRQGLYSGGPRLHAKYGYNLVAAEGGFHYEPEPEQQRIISRIREQRGGGATLRAIAGELNDAATAPPSGREWYPATVKLIAERAAAGPPPEQRPSGG
jgi:DNA invertase Pin-like site-specific DNA recombinase